MDTFSSRSPFDGISSADANRLLPFVLRFLFRPPGEGIPVFSATNASSQGSYSDLFPLALDRFEKRLELITKSNPGVLLIGCPSDTGAGIRRGAAAGPDEIRKAAITHKNFRKWQEDGLILDLGDIAVNPHLLHDEMLSAGQVTRSRLAMYPECPDEIRTLLPVSPLSQLECALSVFGRLFPSIKIMLLGGDHSVAWPMIQARANTHSLESLAIVQIDAHTDLLQLRLGVPYCFGTWSFHAAKLLKDPSHLVQIGLRVSRYDRSHWESTMGVRQFWAEEVRARSIDESITQVIDHLKSRGITEVYFSNDVDGTDEVECSGTGTPAPLGLSSHFVNSLVRELSKYFKMVMCDLVEVAPDLAKSPFERSQTLDLASLYLNESLEALLGR